MFQDKGQQYLSEQMYQALQQVKIHIWYLIKNYQLSKEAGK